MSDADGRSDHSDKGDDAMEMVSGSTAEERAYERKALESGTHGAWPNTTRGPIHASSTGLLQPQPQDDASSLPTATPDWN